MNDTSQSDNVTIQMPIYMVEKIVKRYKGYIKVMTTVGKTEKAVKLINEFEEIVKLIESQAGPILEDET